MFCISAVYFLTSMFWTISTNSTAEEQPECEVRLIWVVVVVEFLRLFCVELQIWARTEEILEKKEKKKSEN